MHDTTASIGTSLSREILRLSAEEMLRSLRQMMTSGWMPRLRSSVTECWVGLVFCSPDGPEVGHQGDVDVADVVPADVLAELPDGFQEGEDLDVADGAADLGDDHVDGVGGQALDPVFDLVGDVRDDLDGLAEEVAATLLGDHALVDRPGGGVGFPVQALVDEPLVVAQVEVGLPAVVGDEDLAVLERVHGSGVDVDVRVELLHRDPQAPALEQPAQRRRGQTLSQGTRHPTGDEDVLRQDAPPLESVATALGGPTGRPPHPTAPRSLAGGYCCRSVGRKGQPLGQ